MLNSESKNLELNIGKMHAPLPGRQLIGFCTHFAEHSELQSISSLLRHTKLSPFFSDYSLHLLYLLARDA